MALKLKHSDRFYESKALRDLLACMTCRKHRKSESDSADTGTGQATGGGFTTPVIAGESGNSNKNTNPTSTPSYLTPNEDTCHSTKTSEPYVTYLLNTYIIHYIFYLIKRLSEFV